MNLGMETECVESKRSASALREGMESVAPSSTSWNSYCGERICPSRLAWR